MSEPKKTEVGKSRKSRTAQLKTYILKLNGTEKLVLAKTEKEALQKEGFSIRPATQEELYKRLNSEAIKYGPDKE